MPNEEAELWFYYLLFDSLISWIMGEYQNNIIASGSVNMMKDIQFYFVFQKTESWENDKTLSDMEKFFWDLTSSRTRLLNVLKKQAQTVDVRQFIWLFNNNKIDDNLIIII